MPPLRRANQRDTFQFTTDAAELRQVGTQFDPIAVDAFVREDATVREMVAMKCGEAVLPVPHS